MRASHWLVGGILLTAGLMLVDPALAQAVPAAPAPVDNGGALTRAMGQISGDGRSLSLSCLLYTSPSPRDS